VWAIGYIMMKIPETTQHQYGEERAVTGLAGLLAMACPTVIYFALTGVLVMLHFSLSRDK
jgi:hypothetical protein